MGKIRENFNYLLCFGTGMIVGVLIGAIGITTLVSYRMDTLYENIVNLEIAAKEKDAKLKKLEESINTMNLILEGIEVNIDFKGVDEENNIERIEIEKAIREKYANLIGREVKEIDPDLVTEVIDQRIFKLEGKEYKLRVRKLVLTEILRLWVDVELIDPDLSE